MAAPRTVGLVLDNLAMVASSNPRWALTRLGGVKASHYREVVLALLEMNEKGKLATDLVQRDIFDEGSFEDLEELEGGGTGVLDVVSHSSGNIAFLSKKTH